MNSENSAFCLFTPKEQSELNQGFENMNPSDFPTDAISKHQLNLSLMSNQKFNPSKDPSPYVSAFNEAFSKSKNHFQRVSIKEQSSFLLQTPVESIQKNASPSEQQKNIEKKMKWLALMKGLSQNCLDLKQIQKKFKNPNVRGKRELLDYLKEGKRNAERALRRLQSD